MNNKIDPYEQMLVESFKQNILDGRVSVPEIKKMIEENKLSDAQMEVIEELAPMLGGLGGMLKKGAQGVGNMAKSVGQGVANVANRAGQGIKQAGQGMANAYQQGRQQQINQNAFNQVKRVYDGQFAKMLQAVSQANQNNPQVADAVTNVDAWMKYLGQLIYGSGQVR